MECCMMRNTMVGNQDVDVIRIVHPSRSGRRVKSITLCISIHVVRRTLGCHSMVEQEYLA